MSAHGEPRQVSESKPDHEIFGEMASWIQKFPEGQVISFNFNGSQVSVYQKGEEVIFRQGPAELAVKFHEGVGTYSKENLHTGIFEEKTYPNSINIRSEAGTANLSYPETSGLRDINNPAVKLSKNLMKAFDADSQKSEVKDGLIGAISEEVRRQIEANAEPRRNSVPVDRRQDYVAMDSMDRHDRR